MIKQEREKDAPSLLVDAGNFAPYDQTFEPWEWAGFVMETMSRLGYEVVTPGDLEMVQGAEALRELYGRHPEVQVVSANVLDEDGNHLFPQYAIIKKGDLKIGVTGATGESYYDFNVSRGIVKVNDFTFEDTREALRRVIEELRQEADLVVALLHHGPGDVHRIVRDVPGMDVVVAGHNPGYMFNPDTLGTTLILRPGNRGQYLSVLNLTVDADQGAITEYNGEGRPLDGNVEKDPELEPVLVEWEKDFKKRKHEARRERLSKAQQQGS
jgi:2',3'-cyclic-nucleotide 2'-phosphodiesterase (5'-nucleotidase family)